MAGSRVVIDLQASEGDIDGRPGGEGIRVKEWELNVASAGAQRIPLSGSPVTIQLPPGGARVLIVQVLDYTVAPTLTWNDGASKSETFTGGRAVWSDSTGPLVTSASITGTGTVRVLVAG